MGLSLLGGLFLGLGIDDDQVGRVVLNKLERKYSRDEDALISYLGECRGRLDDIQYADERLEKLEKLLAAQQKTIDTQAKQIETLLAAAQLTSRVVQALPVASANEEVDS